MTPQMLTCIALFVFMLVSFLMAKIPLGVTAGITAALLVLTGCTEAKTILSSIGSANTIIIGSMIVLASGLGRTSFPSKLTAGIRKITGGNYKLAYLGVILIAVTLTSLLTSPMAAYAIVFPIMDSVCDEFGVSRSKAQFPLVVTCLACCGILPLGYAISQSAVYSGYMETYGFAQAFEAMDFFKGRWPFILIVVAWAYFIAPKITPEKPVTPIAALETKKADTKKLGKVADIAGVIIFAVVILGFIFSKKLPKQCVLDAQERGVIFELSHGTNAYSYDTAEAAWKAGFFVDTVCSDIHGRNVNGPVFSPGVIYTKVRGLTGKPWWWILNKAIAAPVHLQNIPEKATEIQENMPADLTIFKIESGEFTYLDSKKVSRTFSEKITPSYTCFGKDVYTCR